MRIQSLLYTPRVALAIFPCDKDLCIHGVNFEIKRHIRFLGCVILEKGNSASLSSTKGVCLSPAPPNDILNSYMKESP